MNATPRRAAVATIVAVGAALGSTTVAHAATAYVPFTCDDGRTLLLRVPSNQAENTWGAGQIVEGGSGHVVPLAFTYIFTPTGGEPTIQTAVKGGGHAGPKDATATCTATFEDPEGTLTIMVTVFTRP
jgi:hypothetical protein